MVGDADGNAIYVGFQTNAATNRDVWVGQYDADGDEVWSIDFDGGTSQIDEARSVALAPNGDLIVAGVERLSTGFVRRFDPDGNAVWSTTNLAGLPAGVSVDALGMIYLGGEVFAGDGYDAWVGQYDEDGNEVWVTQSNVAGDDRILDVAVGELGLVTVGHRPAAGEEFNWWIERLDADDGALTWSTSYDGAASGADQATSVALDSASAIVVGGYVAGASGRDIRVAKYDADGDEVWSDTIDGTSSGDDVGAAVAVDAGDNVVAAGALYEFGEGTNLWARRYDTDGTELWTFSSDGGPAGYDFIGGAATDACGRPLLAGSENAAGGWSERWFGARCWCFVLASTSPVATLSAAKRSSVPLRM